MNKPPELRTERLVLRPFRFDDVDDVFAYVDPEWSRYLFVELKDYSRRDAEEFVAKSILHDWAVEPIFAITLDGRVIGGTHLSIDSAIGTAMLGYAIARDRWGQGLVPEATVALFDWAFATYEGISRIEAHADLRNERSWRVMEKLGMKREGVLRKRRPISGVRADEVIYGILREEWQAR
jgi:ribosomal-protein-alanine N-acetyltransferase